MSTKLPTGMDDGRALAQTIVDTLPGPLLILDDELRVVVASRSYYVTFKVSRQDVQGRPVYVLATASGIARNCGPCSRRF